MAAVSSVVPSPTTPKLWENIGPLVKDRPPVRANPLTVELEAFRLVAVALVAVELVVIKSVVVMLVVVRLVTTALVADRLVAVMLVRLALLAFTPLEVIFPVRILNTFKVPDDTSVATSPVALILEAEIFVAETDVAERFPIVAVETFIPARPRLPIVAFVAIKLLIVAFGTSILLRDNPLNVDEFVTDKLVILTD
jgi:hypothetical protein